MITTNTVIPTQGSHGFIENLHFSLIKHYPGMLAFGAIVIVHFAIAKIIEKYIKYPSQLRISPLQLYRKQILG